jgi:hypothetical protein
MFPAGRRKQQAGRLFHPDSVPPGHSLPTALHDAAFRLAIADSLLITPKTVAGE